MWAELCVLSQGRGWRRQQQTPDPCRAACISGALVQLAPVGLLCVLEPLQPAPAEVCVWEPSTSSGLLLLTCSDGSSTGRSPQSWALTGKTPECITALINHGIAFAVFGCWGITGSHLEEQGGMVAPVCYCGNEEGFERLSLVRDGSNTALNSSWCSAQCLLHCRLLY